MKKKEPTQDIEAVIDELRRRIDALERSQRLRARHHTEPVLIGGGAELERARKVASWSLRELAVGCGCRAWTVRCWELNKHPMPRWRAQQIVQIFRTSNAAPPRWGDLDAWTEEEDRTL
jgi:hypothetical protein